MPMNTSRQIKQPQSSLVFEYLLLHNEIKDSIATIDLLGINSKICNLYQKYMLPIMLKLLSFLGAIINGWCFHISTGMSKPEAYYLSFH